MPLTKKSQRKPASHLAWWVIKPTGNTVSSKLENPKPQNLFLELVLQALFLSTDICLGFLWLWFLISVV